jgi:ABC-2 type transport system ATP-binding protein
VQAVCNRVQIIHEGELVFTESLADLNQRLRPSSLQVTLAHPPAEGELADLPEITGVEAFGGGAFRLHHATGAEVAEPLARTAVERGWGLRALIPEETSLEQIFVDLTLKDSDSTGKEAA